MDNTYRDMMMAWRVCLSKNWYRILGAARRALHDPCLDGGPTSCILLHRQFQDGLSILRMCACVPFRSCNKPRYVPTHCAEDYRARSSAAHSHTHTRRHAPWVMWVHSDSHSGRTRAHSPL
jgi:hypothetical protein